MIAELNTKRRTGSVRAAAAAFAFLCAGSRVAQADTAYAWGENGARQLGNGTFDESYGLGNQSAPAPVLGLSSGVTLVVAGAYTSFALQNGALYGWGADGVNQLGFVTQSNSATFTPTAVPGFSSGVTAVAAGDSHTVVVQNGTVYDFGDGAYWDTGLGTLTSNGTIPAACPAALER